MSEAGVAIGHFFNHQTHHRGQVHVMLSQTPVRPPSLDLHRIINLATVSVLQNWLQMIDDQSLDLAPLLLDPQAELFDAVENAGTNLIS